MVSIILVFIWWLHIQIVILDSFQGNKVLFRGGDWWNNESYGLFTVNFMIEYGSHYGDCHGFLPGIWF